MFCVILFTVASLQIKCICTGTVAWFSCLCPSLRHSGLWSKGSGSHWLLRTWDALQEVHWKFPLLAVALQMCACGVLRDSVMWLKRQKNALGLTEKRVGCVPRQCVAECELPQVQRQGRRGARSGARCPGGCCCGGESSAVCSW